jgi:hypothetical protein
MSKYPVDNIVVYDLEVLPNYFLAGFEFPDGKIYQYHITDYNQDQVPALRGMLQYIENNGFQLAGFNSIHYDDPVLSEFLLSPTTRAAYMASWKIIVDRAPSWTMAKEVSSIDLMQILPDRIGLKKIGVCMAHKKLQELPVDFNANLSYEMMEVVAKYNVNDLEITRKLVNEVQKDLNLRSIMSDTYGVDLRSKGEATIAEVVLTLEMERRIGVNAKTLKTQAKDRIAQTPYVYVKPPTWWKGLDPSTYPTLTRVVDLGDSLFTRPIHVDHNGRLEGSAVAGSVFIGDRSYTMGVGGLHSLDGAGSWVPKEDEVLVDIDVVSYYPFLMLTQNLYPRHWGETFISIFKELVDQRLEAKRSGDKKTAAILKITINGTYGKTSDKYSALYDPHVTANTTVTGQLALLTLIAMLTTRGGKVVSANTDGMTLLCKRSEYDALKGIVSEWEALTGLEMEYSPYKGLYQMNVNNYLAITTEGEVKKKGVYAIPKIGEFDLRHTPNFQICARAVIEYLSNGTLLSTTIRQCTDIQEFIFTQQVKGDWETSWRGEPLGKMLRYYKSNAEDADAIIRTPTSDTVKGNAGMVAGSDSCRPLPDLPDEFPTDIDYDWYHAKATEWLEEVTRPKTPWVNELAHMMQDQGFYPVLVDTTSKRLSRAAKNVGPEDVDFCSIKPTEKVGTRTGKGTNLMAQRDAEGTVVGLYKVTRVYPAKTRATVMKTEGFELIYGGSVAVDPFFIQPRAVDEDWFDQWYTPNELHKVREVPV